MLEEVQHVVVELHGILQEREVANFGLDQQSSVGDVRHHELGVLALDRLVMVRIDDPGRHMN